MLKACLWLDHTLTWCCTPWYLSKHTYITSPAQDLRKILCFSGVGSPSALCQIQLARLGFVHFLLSWVRQMPSYQWFSTLYITCLIKTNLVFTGMLLLSISVKCWNQWSKDTLTPMKLYWAIEMQLTSNVVSAFIFESYMVHRLWMM